MARSVAPRASLRVSRPRPEASAAPNRLDLLTAVFAHYRETFLRRDAGRDLLAGEGVALDDEWSRAQPIGYADGTLPRRLPRDRASRATLRALGVLTPRGGEALRRCVVFPLHDRDGNVVGLHGVRADGTARMVGDGGLWNRLAVQRGDEIVLTGTVLDALAVGAAGHRAVVPVLALDDELYDFLDDRAPAVVYVALGRGFRRRAWAILETLAARGLPGVYTPTGAPPRTWRELLEADGADGLRRTLDEARRRVASVATAPDPETLRDGLRLNLEGRRYLVRPLGGPGYERLKAHVRAEAGGDRAHVDLLDLYSARARAELAAALAELFGVPAGTVAADLLRIVDAAETFLLQRAGGQRASPGPAETMSRERREAALALLRAPDLCDRIAADLEALGYAGERDNKLLAYLAASSRKLEDPLGVLVQSRSGAGKSALCDAVLRLMPPEEVVRVSKVTAQALFYAGEQELAHKVLAIEEDAGAAEAAYALRVMQSAKGLALATTGKDPATGRLRTEERRVRGPVALFLTTTRAAADGETASRFLVLHVDESREQTARVLDAQRRGETVEGLRLRAAAEARERVHRDAQRLLRPLPVVNPLAERLAVDDRRLASRRDHAKLLALVRAVALLRQVQKRTRRVEVEGRQVEVLEADETDLAIALDLRAAALRAGAEMAEPTRALLAAARGLVAARSNGAPETFTRRELREHTGWADWPLREHLRRLVDLEHLTLLRGRQGQRCVYALADGLDGEGADAAAG